MVSWLRWFVVFTFQVCSIRTNLHQSSLPTNLSSLPMQSMKSLKYSTQQDSNSSLFNKLPLKDEPTKDKENEDNHMPIDLLKQFEKSFLSWIGLKDKPKVNEKVEIASHMMDMYKKKMALLNNVPIKTDNTTMNDQPVDVDDNLMADNIRSFSYTDVRSTVKDYISEVHVYFNVSSIPDTEELHNAELRLVYRADDTLPKKQNSVGSKGQKNKKRKPWSRKDEIYIQRVTAFEVVRPVRNSSPDPVLRILDTSLVDTRKSGSFTLDVSPAVQKWHENPRKNYGLVIEVKPYNSLLRGTPKKTNHVRLRRDVSNPVHWREEQPSLLIYSNDMNVKHRSKRSHAQTIMKQHPLCARYNLYVDFRAVGWDNWILAPDSYEAYYCKGECPHPIPAYLQPTNHAVIQNTIRYSYLPSLPPVCCVPTKMNAFSLLYKDLEPTVVTLKTYQDMQVDSCGCR